MINHFSPEMYRSLLAKGDFADLFAEESSTRYLRWEEGRIDDVSHGQSSGMGLRYLLNRETRFGFVDASRPVTGEPTGEEWGALETLSRDISSGLPARAASSMEPVRQADSPPPASETKLSQAAAELEKAYRAAQIHKSIRQVTLSYSERTRRIGYVNASGESFVEERVYRIMAASITAQKNGLVQTALEVSTEGLKEAGQVARVSAERALNKLSAPVCPLGEFPVVIGSPAGGTLIHEAVGHSLEADAVLEGISPAFAGKVGMRVAHEKVTVVDDPTVPGGRGSFAFDDEGIRSQRTVLVENGILRTYLYDRLAAKQQGIPSNGHGRRESYSARPIPRMSNTFVLSGNDDPGEILSTLKKGLYVTRMGGGQVNTATGDFMFEVEEGFWVENGKIRNMVRGVGLLGNGAEVLQSIDRVGTDFGWGYGTCGKEGQGVPVSDGLPTIRIPKLVLGGQSADPSR